MKYRIGTVITHDELVGLQLLVDSYGVHQGAGVSRGDAQTRAAIQWISRLIPVRVRAHRAKDKP